MHLLPSVNCTPDAAVQTEGPWFRPKQAWRVLVVFLGMAILGGCANMHPRALPPMSELPTHSQSGSAQAQRDQASGLSVPPLASASVPMPSREAPATANAFDILNDTHDLWARMRKGFALPPMESDLVERHAQRFERIRYFDQRASRIRQLMPVVVQAIEERKLPTELALVPLVESALNCSAKSVVAATGCWQFMPATAKDQQLMVSVLVDQRRDLLKSTEAALDYLQSLHQQTQDWHLAMAAYNWGIGRVLRLRDAARTNGQPTSFVALANRFPDETRNYVAQIEALKRIILQADADDLPEVPDQALIQTVRLTQDIDLALASRWAGISPEALLQLNHAIRPPVILAAATPEILLSAQAAERFLAAARQHRGPWASWTVVRTQGNAKLQDLARQYGTTAERLREVNGGTAGHKPTPGSAMLVPNKGNYKQVSADLVAVAQRQWVPEVVRISIKARPKESLAQLAKRMRIGLPLLVSWNPGLAANKPIKKGARVVLLVAPEDKSKYLTIASDTPRKSTRQ